MPNFFRERLEQSRVKAELVSDYFIAWARIMARRSEKIGYLDFFAGPGRYDSGAKSTPLLVLEKAIQLPELSARLVSVFNDIDPDASSSLEKEINALPGIDSLTFEPDVITGPVDDEFAEFFEGMKTIPALSFFDPWGYKGVTMRLIHSVLKDWGSEVIVFFNYNRINMGVGNPIVRNHMRAIFGRNRFRSLRSNLQGKTPRGRERLIRKALEESIEESGRRYLLWFRFARKNGRTSHYICFVSKHPLGYKIMKGIMARKGTHDADGVPLFEYLPEGTVHQLELNAPRPLQSLSADLATKFRGRRISVDEIIEEHWVGQPFLEEHYKEVLKAMEAQGRVKCRPAADERKKGTLAGHVIVSFPR